MIKAIACIVLIVGLLKFAQEAPKLFKDMFDGGKLFDGLDLKPGAARRDLAAAGKTVKGIGAGAKAIGQGVAAPFKGMATAGKAISGAVSGAHAGAVNGGGFGGGVRGLIAGGKAGAHAQMGMAGMAGGYAGGFAGATTAKQRGAFDTGRTQFDTVHKAMMASSEKKVNEKKDAKKALDAEYQNNINKYRQEHVQAYMQAAKDSGAHTTEMNKLIAAEAARTGKSESELRSNVDYMKNAWDQANKNVAASVDKKLREEAEGLYKGGYEARKSALDKEIAEAKAKSIDMPTAEKAIQEMMASKENWGDNISGNYNTIFNDKMHGNMDAAVAASINSGLQSALGSDKTYAGKGGTNLTDADISRLVGSINNLSNMSGRSPEQETDLANQRMALATIMDNMNGAMSDANRNLSLADTTQKTYSPQPTKPAGGDGGKK